MALLIVTLAALVAGVLARWGLLRLETDASVLARVPMVWLCMVSVGAAWGAFWAGGGVGLVPAMLVGQLMLAAWIDRQTTWVPDSVLLPLLMLCGMHVADGGVGSAFGDMAAGVGLGAAIWLGALLLWRLQAALDRVILTPPDMIAGALPFLLLGISFAASLAYLVAAGFALAVLKSRTVRRIFVNEDATRQGAQHLGLPQDRPALPALSLFLPVLSGVFLLRHWVEWIGFELYL